MVKLEKILAGALVLVLSLVCGSAFGQYGGGSGTEADPFQIWDANNMNEIGLHGQDWGKCFELMADIDLGGYTGDEFNIIGGDDAFRGVFDGNHHVISNFTYDSNDVYCIGLFAYIDSAQIKNLGLITADVRGETGSYVGSLVGVMAYANTVTNCYSDGGTVIGADCVGGLVGFSVAGGGNHQVLCNRQSCGEWGLHRRVGGE